ncbi:MAG: hypothetical protein AAF745_09715 [Planctomycetota bacterium]
MRLFETISMQIAKLIQQVEIRGTLASYGGNHATLLGSNDRRGLFGSAAINPVVVKPRYAMRSSVTGPNDSRTTATVTHGGSIGCGLFRHDALDLDQTCPANRLSMVLKTS